MEAHSLCVLWILILSFPSDILMDRSSIQAIIIASPTNFNPGEGGIQSFKSKNKYFIYCLLLDGEHSIRIDGNGPVRLQALVYLAGVGASKSGATVVKFIGLFAATSCDGMAINVNGESYQVTFTNGLVAYNHGKRRSQNIAQTLPNTNWEPNDISGTRITLSFPNGLSKTTSKKDNEWIGVTSIPSQEAGTYQRQDTSSSANPEITAFITNGDDTIGASTIKQYKTNDNTYWITCLKLNNLVYIEIDGERTSIIYVAILHVKIVYAFEYNEALIWLAVATCDDVYKLIGVESTSEFGVRFPGNRWEYFTYVNARGVQKKTRTPGSRLDALSWIEIPQSEHKRFFEKTKKMAKKLSRTVWSGTLQTFD